MQCLRVRCDVNIITQFQLITEKQLNYKTRTQKNKQEKRNGEQNHKRVKAIHAWKGISQISAQNLK